MPNETPKAPAPVEIIMSKLLETLHELRTPTRASIRL